MEKGGAAHDGFGSSITYSERSGTNYVFYVRNSGTFIGIAPVLLTYSKAEEPNRLRETAARWLTLN